MRASSTRRSRRPTACSRREFTTLKALWLALRPGLVFAAEGEPYEKALAAAGDSGVELVTCSTGVATDHDAIRRTGRQAGDRGRRRRAPARGSRYGGEDPVHVGIDRPAQGRDQHAEDAVREPGDAAHGAAAAGRRSAGALRLAAVEPHLRRQPQFRHRALQRRHALHRRRQAHPRGFRHDPRQPQGRGDDGLFQRPARIRPAGAAVARRPRAPPSFLQPAEDAVLRRGVAPATGRRRPRRRRARRARPTDPARHGPWRHRERAVRAVRGRRGLHRRTYRRAGAGRRAQAGAGRRQARGTAARAEHHARLLARRRS